MDLKFNFITWYFNEFSFDPLFKEMLSIKEGSPWHREENIGIHTNMVVGQYLTRAGTAWLNNEHLGAIACAFHDVGKPPSMITKYKEERGEYRAFHGHEQVSARLWEDYAARNWHHLVELFALRPVDIYKIGWMIEHHVPWATTDTAKLDRLARTASELDIIYTFVDVLKADTTGRIAEDMDIQNVKADTWGDEFIKRAHNSQCMIDKIQMENHSGPVLHMPIGPSGCGKSTVRHSDFDLLGAHHYSWDKLIVEWYDSDYDTAWKMAFVEDPKFKQKAFAEFVRVIKTNVDIFVDNTNLSPKRRAGFIAEARRRGYKIVGHLFPIALQTVLDRQHTREGRSTPDVVVTTQYNALSLPQYGEFDEINIHSGNLID